MSGSGLVRRDGKEPGDSGRAPSAWLTALSLAAIAGLIALGIWQIERRAWKLALIDRVEHRIHAAPAAMPPPPAWSAISAASDEYRHVALTGYFLNDRETLVRAVTDHGGGYWVLTPLITDDGATVLVNRGFVPPERRDPAARQVSGSSASVRITGLLRISEPNGGFLRYNDPAHDRWYSRDVAAIAAARGLRNVAPFFIDADAAPRGDGDPIGGLTVVRFPNNHLIYALTWFGMALMLAGHLLVTFGGGLFRRGRMVRAAVGKAEAARGTGSDAGTIVEPT